MHPNARSTDVILPPNARDKYGRTLHIGDEIVAPGQRLESPEMRLVDIRPNLHPQAQPNTLIAIAVIEVQISLPANRPSGTLVRTRTAEARQAFIESQGSAGDERYGAISRRPDEGAVNGAAVVPATPEGVTPADEAGPTSGPRRIVES